MRVLRIVLGILFALLALFVGGCAVMAFGSKGYGTEAITPIASVVALVSGGLSWLCFPKRE